ncbi:hypothetical protein DAPK24_048990 [Pichia kluyveri]|uniref:FAD-binding FR-type domain-containing protein n=1 Tax=Pichia kluyveri TaxID=36015 RepID=A0AAV5R9S2_PICKL|nr:hypothetical protein DAPK24_048990 [Pichia kluyveri]
MKLLTLLQFLLLSLTVHAGKWESYSHAYYATIGCKLAVDKVANFCGVAEAAAKYACICKNENALVSWINCGLEYFPEINEKNIYSNIVDQCLTNSKVNSTKMNEKYLTNLYNENKSSIVNVKNFTSHDFKKNNTDFPIAGHALSKIAHVDYHGYRSRWGNVSTSHYLGISFVAACGAIALIAGLINWSIRLRLINSLPKVIKKYFTLGLLGKNHLHTNTNSLGFNPDRLETFFIICMFLYTILSMFIIGYSYPKGDPIFARKKTGVSRYYADRAIILACYQLPLLFLFPGRNNFFQYITRWKQARFVTFHKWLARIIFLEILVHSFCMAAQTASLPKFAHRIKTGYFREGISAVVFFFVILLASGRLIRKYSYELFFLTHIILVPNFLWLAWYHAHSQDYQQFFYACCGVWIFDRVVRIIRITSFGIKKVEIDFYGGEEILKLTVPKSALQNCYPGAHAYIHFLTPTRFWQSHPFTVYPSATDDNVFHLNCRVKRGITQFLAKKCKETPNGKISMNILIDGFYGEQSPYQNYDKTVLITGGTGISGPYYHAKNLIANNSTKEVKLYWSIRTLQSVESYLPEILSFKDTSIKPIIYVSNPGSSLTTSSDDGEKKDGDSITDDKEPDHDNLNDEEILKLLSFAEIKLGRMSASEIVTEEINNSQGSVAFGACSHTQVVDEVRRTVAGVVTSTSNRVDYYEEMQLW